MNNNNNITHQPQQQLLVEDMSLMMDTEAQALSQRSTRKGFGCMHKIMKKANSSYSSVKTAATTLLMASIEGEDFRNFDFDQHAHQHDNDNESLAWENFNESQLSRSGKDQEHGDNLDDISVSSSASMDMFELERLSASLGYASEPYESFHSSYNLGTALGQGAFGSVHKCTVKTGSGSARRNSFAVKAVPMHLYNHDEIEILEELEDCDTVVQVKDVFHEREETYIVMEEMQGGELLARIAAKECYSEQEARVVIRTLLETIQFCHERGIAHCDIKPENILLEAQDDDTRVKLADFGLAKRFRNEDGTFEPMFDMHGSAEYAAPEVFNRTQDDEEGYDERCDIWSCGVVLYVLLGGYAPFEADNTDDMIKLVGKGSFKFHRKYWKAISREAKILIARMMQVDPNKRISLEEALASPWLCEKKSATDGPRRHNSTPTFK